MFAKYLLLIIVAVFFGMGTPAEAGRIEPKISTAKTYPGSQNRQYSVFIPSAYTGESPVPMVMVLHGCAQSDSNMIEETAFKELAERENFVVVYPFITRYPPVPPRQTNCWGFFIPNHIHQGAGEVEDLYEIARAVEAEFKIDQNRRYVTGLSSGAGMAVALAVARSEYFAAAGTVEGLPYSETSASVGFVCANPGQFKPVAALVAAMLAEQSRPEDQRPVPVMVIHSRNDCVVNIKASENIRDSWLRLYGVDATPAAAADCSAEGVACSHTKYGSQQRSIVETVFYDGERSDGIIGRGSHYWVGDHSGEFANPRGPSASALLWAFFQSHPFSLEDAAAAR
jgi:poly(hydroxyalkanoate) depolymerase family esterase